MIITFLCGVGTSLLVLTGARGGKCDVRCAMCAMCAIRGVPCLPGDDSEGGKSGSGGGSSEGGPAY